MKLRRKQLSAFIGAVLALSLAACGSDSMGPGSTDTDGALQSLALGLGGISGLGNAVALQMGGSSSKLGQFVDQAQVTIGGKSYTMFGLGVRESFPPGTCLERLFVSPSVLDPSLPCEDPTLSTALIFWQSASRFAPPDRLLIVTGDPGVNDFGFLQSLTIPTTNVGFAMYIEGRDKFWASSAGQFTLDVTPGTQTCALPLPPFAKAATCTVAMFSGHGDITFEDFESLAPSSNANTLTVSIPQQSIHGVWQAITETQPYVPTSR